MSQTRITAVVVALSFLGISVETCQAGPLLDWLRGRRAVVQSRYFRYRYNAYYRGPAVQNYAQMPGSCTTTCPKTCYQTVNRVVASYVPYTAFRTEWYRVPVTYYRPVTSTNPQTGCITTCMKPCTYYQMQARRVPYTTYQTVYRTVQHRVPYTVYETNYSSCGSCGTCSSCGTGSTSPYTGTPVQSMPATTTYGLNPGSGYQVPANTVPQLNPSEIQPDTTLQKPATEVPAPEPEPKPSTTNSSHSNPNLNRPQNPPPVVDQDNRTASLIRGKWNYSPAQHAGYLTSVDRKSDSPNRLSGFSSDSSKPEGPAFRSSGWKSVRN